MATSQPPKLIEAQPQLYVTDLHAAVAFYGEKLGFDLVFAHGEPAFYAQVRRGPARLNLRLARGPVFDAEFLAREADPICATLAAENIAALYEDCRAAGAEMHQALKRESWGAQTFIVRDPAGNLILFAGT